MRSRALLAISIGFALLLVPLTRQGYHRALAQVDATPLPAV
jgi:hypothetical protein